MTGNEIMVVEDGANIAGRVVYWRLEGTLELDVLSDAWLAAGLDEKLLPNPPTPERALKRTLQSFSSNRTLVRPLGGGVSGYALIEEHADERRLEHAQGLTAVIDTAGERAVPALDVEPSDHEMAADVRLRYASTLMELDTRDASGWLGKLVEDVSAVGLRDKGGVYFVPRDSLPTWDRYVEVIGDVSDHHVFQIPAMRTRDAIAAVVDAIVSEATAVAGDIERDLADEDRELGKRALRTRVERCERTLAKVGRYEELLDEKLDDVRDRIGELRAQVATALLMAETGEETDR